MVQHTSFAAMPCPIARGLDHVGEWWSILILRDALKGSTRFEQFQTGLGIAPGILARRLAALTRSGLLERRRYSERPPRHEYVVTASCRDFRPVLLAMFAWGNRHFPPEGSTTRIIRRATGEAVDPVLVDPATNRPVDGPDYIIVSSPVAASTPPPAPPA